MGMREGNGEWVMENGERHGGDGCRSRFGRRISDPNQQFPFPIPHYLSPVTAPDTPRAKDLTDAAGKR